MSERRALLVLFAFACGWVGSAHADKLDKEAKKWLDDMAPLILPDEDKTYRSLKDKADRDEFQKIFWARRNPLGPAAPDNPARSDYEKLKASIEQRFKAAGQAPTTTDCARVLALLGEPSEVKKGKSDEDEEDRHGPRQPEVWTYKERPGLNITGGQLQIGLDSQCQLPQGSRFKDQLNRRAEALIVSPNIGYKLDKDGRLTKLAELLPKPTAAQALLKEPRQDFQSSAEVKLTMRGNGGATYVAGLLRGVAAGLATQDEGGRKRVNLVVAAQALDEKGVLAAATEQETSADVGADDAFFASFGVVLRPGKYTLRAGALDKGGRGSVDTLSIEVPDLAGGELAISDLLVLSDVQENVNVEPKDPLAAFAMGTAKMIPRFHNTFTKAESIQVLGLVYNAQLDTNGKSSVSCRFAILKGGQPFRSTSEDQTFDTPVATPGIGPVSLSGMQPGKYSVQLKVSDRVAQKDYAKEAPFEVLP